MLTHACYAVLKKNKLFFCTPRQMNQLSIIDTTTNIVKNFIQDVIYLSHRHTFFFNFIKRTLIHVSTKNTVCTTGVTDFVKI